MSRYEYKTVALPAVLRGKRRRRQSEADLVAETLGEALQAEAVDGWEYMRAETLSAAGRAGLFARGEQETAYTVLVFRRVLSAVWQAEDAPTERRRVARGRESIGSADRAGGEPARPVAPSAVSEPSLSVPDMPTEVRDLRPPLGSTRD